MSTRFTVNILRVTLLTYLGGRIARLEHLATEAQTREDALAQMGAPTGHHPGCPDKVSDDYRACGKALALVSDLIRADERAQSYHLSARDLVTLDLGVAGTADPLYERGASALEITVQHDHLLRLIRARVGEIEELRAKALDREGKLTAAAGRPPVGFQLRSAALEAQGKALALLADLLVVDARGSQVLNLDDLAALNLITPSIGVIGPGHYA